MFLFVYAAGCVCWWHCFFCVCVKSVNVCGVFVPSAFWGNWGLSDGGLQSQCCYHLQNPSRGWTGTHTFTGSCTLSTWLTLSGTNTESLTLTHTLPDGPNLFFPFCRLPFMAWGLTIRNCVCPGTNQRCLWTQPTPTRQSQRKRRSASCPFHTTAFLLDRIITDKLQPCVS